MAEIPIQPKRQGSKWWMWLLPLLLVLALWYFLRNDDDREAGLAPTGDAGVVIDPAVAFVHPAAPPCRIAA